jgi:hypothetical protein
MRNLQACQGDFVLDGETIGDYIEVVFHSAQWHEVNELKVVFQIRHSLIHNPEEPEVAYTLLGPTLIARVFESMVDDGETHRLRCIVREQDNQKWHLFAVDGQIPGYQSDIGRRPNN